MNGKPLWNIYYKKQTTDQIFTSSKLKHERQKTGWIIIYLPQNVNDISENYIKGIPALEGMCVIGRKIHKIKC